MRIQYKSFFSMIMAAFLVSACGNDTHTSGRHNDIPNNPDPGTTTNPDPGTTTNPDPGTTTNPEPDTPENPEASSCVHDGDCPSGSTCVQNRCMPKITQKECQVDENCPSGKTCDHGVCKDKTPEHECQNNEDCPTDSFCDDSHVCCSHDSACGNSCCSEDRVCVNETCILRCSDQQTYCLGQDSNMEPIESCCGMNELCIDGACFLPDSSCNDNYACKDNEYCELVSHTCLPKSNTEASCLADAWNGGEFVPRLLYHWGVGELTPVDFPDHINVMMTPMVADINDDGVPEIVFNSWLKNSTQYEDNGVLRIISGKDGKLLASSNAELMTDPRSQVAIGRIYPKDVTTYHGVDVSGLQIITCSEDNRLVAYNHRAELIWKGTSEIDECGSTAMGLADFDGDELPEIHARYQIFNAQTGEHIAGLESDMSTADNMSDSNYAIAADINNDGTPELIGGNIAYQVNLTTGQLTPVYHRTDQPDGFPAIADLDLDGHPEIVSVRKRANDMEELAHTVMAFRNDGTDFWSTPVDVHLGTLDDWGGGPATIAKIDDDPHPSVTLSSGTHYIALDYQGNIKWSKKIDDMSSRSTGSSVFDFNGDGNAEILYGDELFLRVYDGKTGDTIFCLCNTTTTLYEYPVVADVNNDGHAEIVIVSNRYRSNKHCPDSPENTIGEVDDCILSIMNGDYTKRTGTSGVRVFSGEQQTDDGLIPSKWMPTRNIYNQHAYSITNVLDDGTIPAHVRSNWTIPELNNFRLNTLREPSHYQLYINIYETSISSPHNCSAKQPVYFTVYNSGRVPVEAGMPIRIEVRNSLTDSEPFEIYEVETQTEIPVAGHEELIAEIDLPQNTDHLFIQFVATDHDVCRVSEDNEVYANYELSCYNH